MNFHPVQLEESNEWLFVLGNTMRAMIENTDKSQLEELHLILTKSSSQELKLALDFCQGKFGQKNFSYRKHKNYLYLCSLIATYPDFDLSLQEQEYLRQVITWRQFLLYEELKK